jgi:hypothetical protein
MNPESAGVPGVMLRLKRRIASYMHMLQISLNTCISVTVRTLACLVFSQEMLALDLA